MESVETKWHKHLTLYNIMYCPNCEQEYDGKFCPECGTKLLEKPAAKGGLNVSVGDAAAISGGLHTSDSHNVHNEDKSIHNTTNTTSTVNNITNVAAQKSEMEILQEKKSCYLNECKRAFEDNVLEQAEVIALEECRIKLGLDKSTADGILESVRVMSERNARKTTLNPIARTKLNLLTKNLQKNEVKALMDQIDGLEAIVNKYDSDELTRKYYLVLAALKSDKCIAQFENTKTDNYWKTFWSYLAYIKAGRRSEAENILASLDRFTSYPEDNMTVLATAGAIMRDDKSEAQEYLGALIGDYTPALQRFVDSIYLLLDPETAKEMGASENTCAFYLVNFFGQKDPKVKEEVERKRKEEKAAKHKAEEEAKRKAEEEAKRKVEENQHKKAEENQCRVEKEIRLNTESANSLYDIILVQGGLKTLLVVKAIKEALDLNLEEAKDLYENAPVILRKGICKDEAERIKGIIENEGAVVEIKISCEKKEFDKNDYITPTKVVSKLLSDLVDGFEIINVFSSNEPYKVCRYLISQKEWEVIMEHNPSYKKGNDLPVTNITLDEAEIFVQKINKIVADEFPIYGERFMIPNREMQWLGYQKKFAESFNIVPRDLYCWHVDNSGGQLQPIGKLQPSAGLYDACGLVYEWCTMKKYDSLYGGSAFEPREKLLLKPSNRSSLKYRDKRYNDVGLRLVAKNK